MTAETLADVAQARERFTVTITEPDPNAALKSLRKVGTARANEASSGKLAGKLDYGVTGEREEMLVQTSRFETSPEFQGQHVALLLADEVRRHYGVLTLHASPAEPTESGAHLLASLRRRGIMPSNA